MIHIFGGGTFSHVRSHLAIAAPAFGGTARKLWELFHKEHLCKGGRALAYPRLHLTKMADHKSTLVTNADVAARVDELVADPDTRVIVFNVALADFDGQIGDMPSGKYAERLKTAEGARTIDITPADKVIRRIRETRKDIFLVGFKTTAGATPDEQYRAGLNLLKANSANLVVANDLVTRNNMIIAPEESRYCETTDRDQMLAFLVKMVESRTRNTFTRSEVVPGNLYQFQSHGMIPNNLREVINHLVARGAYKPFRNATAGHFAVRIDGGKGCLTSRRKTDYTQPGGLDLVELEYVAHDRVLAYGAKPSVGGQSQRIIFEDWADADCIAHAHIPLKDNPRDDIPLVEQWPNECGSHDCGLATSRALRKITNTKGIHAVMLKDHGPNVVFSKDIPAADVIDFFEANFDIEAKTGGLVA